MRMFFIRHLPYPFPILIPPPLPIPRCIISSCIRILNLSAWLLDLPQLLRFCLRLPCLHFALSLESSRSHPIMLGRLQSRPSRKSKTNPSSSTPTLNIPPPPASPTSSSDRLNQPTASDSPPIPGGYPQPPSPSSSRSAVQASQTASSPSQLDKPLTPSKSTPASPVTTPSGTSPSLSLRNPRFSSFPHLALQQSLKRATRVTQNANSPKILLSRDVDVKLARRGKGRSRRGRKSVNIALLGVWGSVVE